MTLKLKVGTSDNDNSIYFWKLENGIWVNVTPIATNDISRGYYSNTISGPGWYSVNRVIELKYQNGVATKGSSPLSNSQIVVWGNNYSSYSVSTTDSSGSYSVGYKSGDSSFKLSILDDSHISNHTDILLRILFLSYVILIFKTFKNKLKKKRLTKIKLQIFKRRLNKLKTFK